MSSGRRVQVDFREAPKPSGGVRLLTVLDAQTSRRYEGLVSALTPAVVRSGEGEALGIATTSGGLLADRIRWRRALDRAMRRPAILSDVRACYPSIGEEAIAIGLAAAGVRADDTERLQGFLREVRCAGVPGLPVGPAPSAIVAEAVLRSGDDAVRRAGGWIVRWVDDVVISGVDRTSAARAFDAWARALRGLGLEPHEGKTARLDALGAPTDPSASRAIPRGMMRAP